jgi:beta-lactamase superfamily II metal-dependent hydrolase
MRKAGWVLLLLVGILVWICVAGLPDEKLHVVTCDVGQGDAILIFKGNTQVLIDGGSGRAVLECLTKYVPFYDRRLEVVVATHPDGDHVGGLEYVIKRYSLVYFVSTPIGKETGVVERLNKLVKDRKITVRNVYTGDSLRLGNWRLDVVWPEKSWVDERVDIGLNGEGGVLGLNTEAESNDFSISLLLEYGKFKAFFTGDTDARIVPNQMSTGMLTKIDVLKVPHHGSKTGMTDEWLGVLSPDLGLVSVGKTNRYGHPSAEALDLLRNREVRVIRTDVVGDIEVVSDGLRWRVKNGR